MGGAQDDFVEDTDDCEFDTDPGTDILIAGPGDDYMCSWQGEDVMHGQAGNDDLYDYSRGRTRLLGGPDNDTLQAEWDPYGGWATGLPDFVSGDGGIDSAVVDRNDKVTASTEHVSSRS